MDIKTFRKLFAEKVLEHIGKEGFLYRSSRELFIKTEDNNQFFIFVYMYKRSTFIEIQTQIYYGDKLMNRKLKNMDIKPYNEELCGGDIDFISEEYFNKKFPEKYSNLIYMLDESPDCIIKKWLGYYESIMKPFFEECLDPKKLHNIINRRIESAGFAVTYASRVEKFYFVAQNAGVKEEELQKLVDEYESIVIERKDETEYTREYHDTFYKLKEKLFNKK